MWIASNTNKCTKMLQYIQKKRNFKVSFADKKKKHIEHTL